MAKTVLLNTRIFAGAVDITGLSNKVELSSEMEEKDVTAFQPEDSADAGWKELLGGLASTSITAAGQWEAGDSSKVDDDMWAALTARRKAPWTVCPLSASVGSLAYFSSILRGSYKLGDAVGEVAPYEAQGKGDGLLLRGTVAHPPGTARTDEGDGTALELGGIEAGQSLHAALHVLSVAGTSTPTLTVSIESAADEEFTEPTERASFSGAAATDVATRGQMLRVSGPVTDTWWRATWALSGTSPSFLFVVVLGIA